MSVDRLRDAFLAAGYMVDGVKQTGSTVTMIEAYP